MAFVKVHEMPFQKYQPKKIFSSLISNPVTINIRVFEKKLLVDGKSHDLPSWEVNDDRKFHIFSISEKYHLLCFEYLEYLESFEYFYLITLEGILRFKYFEGTPTYIYETGFIFFDFRYVYDHIYHEDYEEYFIAVNFNLEKNSKEKFTAIKTDEKIFTESYAIYFQKKDIIKIYVPEVLWLEDFQKQNPRIKDLEKYYYKVSPTEKITGSDSFLVHFRNSSQVILKEELFELKSDFVNNQMENNNDVYLLEFNYEDFKEKNDDFLKYIESYLITENITEAMTKLLKDHLSQ